MNDFGDKITTNKRKIVKNIFGVIPVGILIIILIWLLLGIVFAIFSFIIFIMILIYLFIWIEQIPEIYENGIRCVFIDHFRTSFIYFNDIKLICPVNWSDPNSRIKGLFIETTYPYKGINQKGHNEISDNEYIILNENEIPFKLLITNMRKKLESKWKEIYREDMFFNYSKGEWFISKQ